MREVGKGNMKIRYIAIYLTLYMVHKHRVKITQVIYLYLSLHCVVNKVNVSHLPSPLPKWIILYMEISNYL
jgi:hypothetical protein